MNDIHPNDNRETTGEDDQNPVKGAWKAQRAGGGWNPLDALKKAQETPWLVDGVIPANSIVWIVGEPACGKTFTLMDIAACVSTGRPWMGRQCDQATAIYIAAEGGTDIHIRRAAAELAAGEHGPLIVAQTRPMLAEPAGLAELMSLVQEATGGQFGGIGFPAVENAMREVCDNFTKYLKPDELEKFKALDRYCALTERRESGGYISKAETAELSDLGNVLAPWNCDIDELTFWGQELAVPRAAAGVQAAYKHIGMLGTPSCATSKKVLLVIDTFSQTAADDTKFVVSQYIKHLRDLIEQAALCGGSITVVVVDHLTKSGGTFMGAQAKLGDSDVMIEVEKRGQLVTVSCPTKMRGGTPFDPIHLELAPYTLDGFNDAQGRPLTSLVVQDGERTHRLRKAAGNSDETYASIVLQLLTDTGGRAAHDDLRLRFFGRPSNADKKPETVARAFNRAVESLTDDEIISKTVSKTGGDDEDVIFYSMA